MTSSLTGPPPTFTSPPGVARRSRRAPKIVLTVAAATGVWLGLTAPTVGPLAPPAPEPVAAVVTPAPRVAIVPPAGPSAQPTVQVMPDAPPAGGADGGFGPNPGGGLR